MRTGPARHRREPDAGSATVELAAAIPLLVAVTLAMVADYSGDHARARDYSERSLALRRSLGDAILVASSTNTLGLTAMRVLGIAEPRGPASERGAGGGRVPRSGRER